MLLDTYKLGQGQGTDVLAIDLSNHDFLSHSYGPDILEVEQLIVTEGQQMTRLLRHLDHNVGLDRTLVVMIAAHGVPPHPDWLQSARVPAGQNPLKKRKTP